MRFSAHDFLVHSTYAPFTYLIPRVLSVLFVSVYASQTISAGVATFGILAFEIWQRESRKGKAEATDYFAGFIPIMFCYFIDLAIWPNGDPDNLGNIIVASILAVFWGVLYVKTKPKR